MNPPLHLLGAPLSAEWFNRGCACRSLDPERLQHELEHEPMLAGTTGEGLAEEIARTRPHLFSANAVFLSQEQYRRIAAIIAAIEAVVALPGYREAALARAPAAARLDFGPLGVFMGYDFHLTAHGPQLIEINTNPGGAMLNAALLRAQHACCREMVDAAFEPPTDMAAFEATLQRMFRHEWQLQRGDAPPGRIAIVDDDPVNQYLHPEFLLYERFFTASGIAAVVTDAKALEWRDGRLWHQNLAVDMVYNRLTDFYLDDPAHAALRAAWEAGAVVMTPHPRAHALFADKRNLITLADPVALEAMGASLADRAVLTAGIPHAQAVTAARADALWASRRQLFFKPALGYGSKAAYRGDKLTRRVWEEILAGDYIAQALTPPSERIVEVDGAIADMKLDVRAFAYAGELQLLAARLYRGQTTNFRTAGGGFAPVFLVRADTTATPVAACECPTTACAADQKLVSPTEG